MPLIWSGTADVHWSSKQPNPLHRYGGGGGEGQLACAMSCHATEVPQLGFRCPFAHDNFPCLFVCPATGVATNFTDGPPPGASTATPRGQVGGGGYRDNWDWVLGQTQLNYLSVYLFIYLSVLSIHICNSTHYLCLLLSRCPFSTGVLRHC